MESTAKVAAGNSIYAGQPWTTILERGNMISQIIMQWLLGWAYLVEGLLRVASFGLIRTNGVCFIEKEVYGEW